MQKIARAFARPRESAPAETSLYEEFPYENLSRPSNCEAQRDIQFSPYAISNLSGGRSVMIAPALDLQLCDGPSDESLMQRIAAREESDLGSLFQRHGKTLKKVIYQVLQDEAETDDVLQESILQVWREAKSYSASLGKPLGWLVTIARRRAIDRVRRRAAYARAKDRFEVYVETEPRSWLQSYATQDNSGADIRLFLERELHRLPDFQREALELSFFNGLSHREIAAHTNTPLGTVKTRLELGLRKLSNSVRAQRSKI